MSRLGMMAAIMAPLYCAAMAHGVLLNQYTFNDGTANDSGPGGANGTVVDPMGVSQFVGGQLDLTANDGIPSNMAENGAYVDLPNGIVSTALQTTGNNAASFEMWVTIETNRTWARLFDFGTSGGGEDISDGGGGEDYLMMVPQGFAGPVMAFESHAFDNSSAQLLDTQPLPTGIEHHIAVSFDQEDETAGPGGTASMYLNNNLVATGPVNEQLLLGELEDEVNDWLGRSQYGADVLIDGFYNEFRIYDHPLTATEVADNFAEGPVAPSIPKLVVDRETGNVTIENQSDSPFEITSYSITSAAGSIDVASSWESIAPDNGWSVQTESDTEVAEAGGSPVTINDGGAISIGTAWIPSQFEDFEFSFEISGGTSELGQVEYIGNGGLPFGRSDLDADGDLDADDWVQFITSNGSDLNGQSMVAAYLQGDLNGDDLNNYDDFLLFREDFIAANGAEAFAALGSVPEPAGILLATLAAIGLLSIGRPRRTT